MYTVCLRYLTVIFGFLLFLVVSVDAQVGPPANDVGIDPEQPIFVDLSKSAATVVLTGTVNTADPSQSGRLYRDGVPSTCAGKTCPGLFSGGPWNYEVVSVYNCSPAPACITVTSTWTGDMIHTSAYSGPYNPLNICQNYLGDIGSSTSGLPFSFTAPAYGTLYFVLQFTATNGTANYTLTIDGVGTGAPTIVTPPDVTLNNVPGQCGASSSQVNLGWPTVTGHDCCPGPLTVSNDAPAFFSASEPTIVTWTVTDGCGNTVTGTQKVTVNDTEPPQLWVILWPQFLAPANGTMRTVTAYVSATDNCPDIDWVLQSVTSNHPDAGTFAGDQPGDISAVFGSKTTSFALRAENSPGRGSRLYTVRYKATDAGNRTVYSTKNVAVAFGGGGLIFSDDSYIPASMELQQNYPNPFSGTTSVTFRVPEDMDASVRVYDLLGREVAVMADGHFPAGSHSLEFSAADLPEGVYMYKLISGSNVVTKKMMVVR